MRTKIPLLLSVVVSFAFVSPALFPQQDPLKEKGATSAKDKEVLHDKFELEDPPAESVLPPDPAFDRFVDLRLLEEALGQEDGRLLADVGLQFLEGERILNRSHRSGIEAATLLARAFGLARLAEDKETLERIQKGAQRSDNKNLQLRLLAMEKLALGSRKVDPALAESLKKASAEGLLLFKSCERLLENALLAHDPEVLDWLAARLPDLGDLDDTQRKHLRQVISDYRKTLSSPASDESQLLLKLEGISRAGANRDINLAKFPKIRQPDAISCGPTSCSMVLGYYGKSAGIGPLKTRCGTRVLSVGNTHIGFTMPSGIENGLQAYGVSATVHKGMNRQSIVNLINANRPPILLVRSGRQYWHYIVAVGYRNSGQTIVIADPADGRISSVSGAALDMGWNFSGEYTGDAIKLPRCRLCSGSGSIWTKCVICGGDGKVYGLKCRPCSGSGRWSAKCTLCNGKGTESDLYRRAVETAGAHGNTLIVPDRAPR